MIHITGDSNVHSFRLIPNSKLYDQRAGLHHIGNLGLPEIDTSPGDILILVYGEHDVRVHLPKIAQVEFGGDMPRAIASVCDKYVATIERFCRPRNIRPLVILPVPPGDKTTADAVVPYVDALAFRVDRSIAVSRELRRVCDVHTIECLDPWEQFRLPDGAMDMSKSDGIVHVADSYCGVISEIVMGTLSSSR